MKRSIIQGYPVMFIVYLLYFQAEEYDHIMPAFGIRFRDENTYDPDDVLIFCNLYHQRLIERKMNEKDLAATRKTCRKHGGEGGCIPLNVRRYSFKTIAVSHIPQFGDAASPVGDVDVIAENAHL
jgi:hypothetical protein